MSTELQQRGRALVDRMTMLSGAASNEVVHEVVLLVQAQPIADDETTEDDDA